MSIADRKDDHVRYAAEQHREGVRYNDFDSISFMHHALAGIDVHDVSLATEIAGMTWSAPVFINAMTGGSDWTGRINRDLAVAARETGVPIASGSMSAFLKNPRVADTFRVLRRENPDGIVFANVNANASPEQACRAVDLLCADALQIHLNAVQEIVMPEGDREFSHWPRSIEDIAASVPVPVVVKEVGFGLSRRTVRQLRDCGVAVVDVSGCGGTNFARIENRRRESADVDYSYLTWWGQSTAACLLDAAPIEGIELLGSGGIRSPLDVARVLALGGRAAGVAGCFLHALVECGVAALIDRIERWLEQLRQIMTILGAPDPAAMTGCDLVITGELADFCRLRGIDVGAYAARTDRSAALPANSHQ
ncbi:type 2 isopentenyl-diphosphate Delta-isomerase [Nocardia sp. CDC159]|uniref:Isopentenyl-diphosphate delta-isomerase n=1 Tax=Nocardia pulmonis TaxID=2951408 RepID=A0A9X2IZT3_9NOCA|nr:MULTISPECIES: type 2 isopentenyl-diphosphate Delta-isomerase [Nocardia]MCM6778447.1 type 2 isopentenyl-diphosphate Delta-isomerase [Nocardia pulmonis]MCM6791336.1 type 2 isopentenyl-diphosphate Delta-isomerase [Nocardia sp. CDC159]